jgi:hypothetical protein
MYPFAMSAIQLTQVENSWCRKMFGAGKLNNLHYSLLSNIFSCINHTMNLAATHFIQALGIPTSSNVKQAIHGSKRRGTEADTENDGDDEGSMDDNNEFDVEVNMEIEATPEDAVAMIGTGDVVSKLMAFVNQLRESSEPTCDFLKHLCRTNE